MSTNGSSSITGLSEEAESFKSLFLAPSLMAMSKLVDPRPPIFLLRNLKLPKNPPPLPKNTNPVPIFHLLHPPYVTSFPSSTCPFCPLPLPSPSKFLHHLSTHHCFMTCYLTDNTLHYIVTRGERKEGIKPFFPPTPPKRWYSSQSSLLPITSHPYPDSDDESDPASFAQTEAASNINEFVDVTPSEKRHMISRNSVFDKPEVVSDREFVRLWLEEVGDGEGEEVEILKECLNLWDNGLIPGKGLVVAMERWREGKRRREEREKEMEDDEDGKTTKNNTKAKKRRC
ncbi:hypothetical protein TrST_g10965 [Triparma strigata]|uniref:Polycomb protein VEFS-Box domain-containing protein n=1 Tax=Triparma strigata TaxID=1606541 RepID=A0A9W7F2W4_9STRA|nr:hypothetical protein TrST_g10965 [Triparma strigata]